MRRLRRSRLSTGQIEAYKLIGLLIYCFLCLSIGFFQGIKQGVRASEPIYPQAKEMATIEHKEVENIKAELPISEKAPIIQLGIGSWYDYTLSGITWSKTHRTCASRFFPRYSTVVVKNLENGKVVECFVNDYVENPDVILDLSSYAFSQLAPLSQGLVKIEVSLKE